MGSDTNSNENCENPENIENIPVIQEQVDNDKLGDHMGQCKWFNDRLGFGFVTVVSKDQQGTDIFVHHSGVKTKNSHYKTLKKGEYIQFDIGESGIKGPNAHQAVNVTGILGGPLMCDCLSTGKRYEEEDVENSRYAKPYFNNNNERPDYRNGQSKRGDWQTVPQRKTVPGHSPPNGRPSYKKALTNKKGGQ